MTEDDANRLAEVMQDGVLELAKTMTDEGVPLAAVMAGIGAAAARLFAANHGLDDAARWFRQQADIIDSAAPVSVN